MARLIEKLMHRLAKIGLVGIEGAGEDLRDSEQYVRKVIQKKGSSKFKYASKYLRSDAEFILSLVQEYPEILEDCEETIYDRYIKDCFMIEEEPVDMMVFVDLCYSKNDLSLLYFPDEIIDKYISWKKDGITIKSFYHGQIYMKELELTENDNLILQMVNFC